MEFDFRPYRRRFQPPLQTSHGLWRERRGIILRLQVPGSLEGQENHSPRAIGYGEIAPLPWFGTETFEEAIAFCQQCRSSSGHDAWQDIRLGSRQTTADNTWLPEALTQQLPPLPGSATAFALGSAIAQVREISPFSTIGQPDLPTNTPALPICALLPTGTAALAHWPALWEQGYRTFKWKIGVADCQQEQHLLHQLRQQLPPAAQLRLDANGGLSLEQAQAWLECCDDLEIEFLEQPLPPEAFSAMVELAQRHRTPLALDESVATLTQLQDCHARGWRGIFVVKGAIAGPPQAVLDFCLRHNLDVVFSSVFETSIASNTVWTMAQRYAAVRHARNDHCNYFHHRNSLHYQSRSADPPIRALGFGVSHWLETDGLNGSSNPSAPCTSAPCTSDTCTPDQSNTCMIDPLTAMAAAEQIWRQLSYST